MTTNHNFNIKWKNYSSMFMKNLFKCYSKGQYCDATIVCQGKFYPVHRLILSLCSKYFEDLFDEAHCKHPFIIVKDIESAQLENLLHFIYEGNLKINGEILPYFLKIAETFGIKGVVKEIQLHSKDNCEDSIREPYQMYFEDNCEFGQEFIPNKYKDNSKICTFFYKNKIKKRDGIDSDKLRCRITSEKHRMAVQVAGESKSSASNMPLTNYSTVAYPDIDQRDKEIGSDELTITSVYCENHSNSASDSDVKNRQNTLSSGYSINTTKLPANDGLEMVSNSIQNLHSGCHGLEKDIVAPFANKILSAKKNLSLFSSNYEKKRLMESTFMQNKEIKEAVLISKLSPKNGNTNLTINQNKNNSATAMVQFPSSDGHGLHVKMNQLESISTETLCFPGVKYDGSNIERFPLPVAKISKCAPQHFTSFYKKSKFKFKTNPTTTLRELDKVKGQNIAGSGLIGQNNNLNKPIISVNQNKVIVNSDLKLCSSLENCQTPDCSVRRDSQVKFSEMRNTLPNGKKYFSPNLNSDEKSYKLNHSLENKIDFTAVPLSTQACKLKCLSLPKTKRKSCVQEYIISHGMSKIKKSKKIVSTISVNKTMTDKLPLKYSPSHEVTKQLNPCVFLEKITLSGDLRTTKTSFSAKRQVSAISSGFEDSTHLKYIDKHFEEVKTGETADCNDAKESGNVNILLSNRITASTKKKRIKKDKSTSEDILVEILEISDQSNHETHIQDFNHKDDKSQGLPASKLKRCAYCLFSTKSYNLLRHHLQETHQNFSTPEVSYREESNNNGPMVIFPSTSFKV